MLLLKRKNSEGYDRIPQRVLVDGIEHLLDPLTHLFNLIYNQKKIPEQWLIAKTIPVFKNKGDKKSVENYRPIANLCSTSKIFEKLILKRISDLQKEFNIDITHENQHGFKDKRSTSTLSIKLQSMIARALDQDEYALVASLDLSSAFDLVNIDLLIKRLKIVGLPSDVVELIEVWLRKRFFYVSVDGKNSVLFDLLLGTIQGSILGPILYAIFVAPVFDLEVFLAFADDSYVTKCNKSLELLMVDMKKSLEAITKWLRQSGLKVNQAKTDLCLFFKRDCRPIEIIIDNCVLTSSKVINVLGVLFDTKLQWTEHVTLAINKSNKSLNALKLIRRYFNSKELIQLITSNYFSILYYNSEVWHLPNLSVNNKKSLLTASSGALKMALHYPKYNISYSNLHCATKRATPDMYCMYKLSLLLYKTFNECIPFDEWIHLNLDQCVNSRQNHFIINRNNNLNIGMNALSSRFFALNNKIPLEWLNDNYIVYKLKCKNKFLKFND